MSHPELGEQVPGGTEGVRGAPRRGDDFFRRMNAVQDVYVLGHSCGEIDYPYFRKVKYSVAGHAQWHFNPYSDEDVRRIEKLKKEISIH